MKIILLLLSSDKYAYPLIRYLVLEGRRYGWRTCVGGVYDESIIQSIANKEDKISKELTLIDINDLQQCGHAIRKADLVIGMIPPLILSQVADLCIRFRKNLVSPEKLNEKILRKHEVAAESDTLLLMECGFSPGVDHITSGKIMHNIQARRGTIHSFKSYSGSLIVDECSNNLLRYKIPVAAEELISLGKKTNRHLINGQYCHIPYNQLFERYEKVGIEGFQDLLAIMEGDSIRDREEYNLQSARTIIKGKLFKKEFVYMWQLLIKLGLTDNQTLIDCNYFNSYREFFQSLLPYSPFETIEKKLQRYFGLSEFEIDMLNHLGFLGDGWIGNANEVSPGQLLEYLLEKNFNRQEEDKDCILMKHEIRYSNKSGNHKLTATLKAFGENKKDAALSKAIGLTTGAAAKACLLGDIQLKGVHTPVAKAIYEPLLSELDDLGLAFNIEEVPEPQLNIIAKEKLDTVTTY